MATLETATVASNNTTLSAATLARMFMITINESVMPMLPMIKDYLRGLKTCNYFLCCSHNKGHNETTTLHFHIACQFVKPTRLSIKKLHGAHVDAGKYGSIQKMADYVRGLTGHDDIEGFEALVDEEYGEMKYHGGLRTRDIIRMSDEELKDLPAPLYKCAKSIADKHKAEKEFFEMLDEIESDTLTHPDVIYITGDSGSGKTYQAYKFAMCMYPKSKIGKCSIENNFFSFVNPDAECFVMEEFRPSDCRASLFLQFTDAYGFNAPIKGGYQYVRPKCLIICSVIPSKEIYQNDEINQQFQRRIKFEFAKTPSNVLAIES